jgi:hypothetical protein
MYSDTAVIRIKRKKAFEACGEGHLHGNSSREAGNCCLGVEEGHNDINDIMILV